MYNFQFDNRILYIILGVMVIMGLVGMTTGTLLGLLLTLPGVIIAITFHEFAHAYAAYKLGDDTPKMQGRLNLNPLSHIDPTGLVLLIFAHVGWGKPVQINPRNFDRKYSQGGRRSNCISCRTFNEFYTCSSFYSNLFYIIKICN